MPRVMNFALVVEMMLLRSSLTVRRSAVGVPQSSGKLMRFPPIVIRVLYLSFLLSRKLHTILTYVLSPFLSFGMSSFLMNMIVSMVVASRRISVQNDFVHTSLYLGCFMRCRYSRRSPVSSSRTAYARSHRNWRGYFHDAACRAVKEALYPCISMQWSMKSCVRDCVSCCCRVLAAGESL